MRILIQQPAVWPWLNLNPEPMGTAADPESVERLYAEWFVACPQSKAQGAVPTPPSPVLNPSRSMGYRPSTHLHCGARRR